MFAILLDIIVILMFCIFVYIGYRRGLVASLLILGKSLIAIILSWFIGKTIAPYVFNAIFRKGLISSVTDQLSTADNLDQLQSAVNQLADQIPDVLLDGKSIKSLIPSDFNVNINSLATSIVDNFLGPIIIIILQAILFALIFIVIRLIFRLLARATRKVNDIPVIGKLNRIFGSLTGVLQAVAYLMIIGMIFDIVIYMTSDTFDLINSDVIQSTYLFMLFYRINPLRLF